MRIVKLASVFLLMALPTLAQHSATPSWSQPAETDTIASTQVLKNQVVIATVPVATLSYTDTSVTAGQVLTYSLINVDSAGNLSAPYTFTSVMIPGGTPPPPTCTAIAVGCTITVVATANIRQAPTSSTTAPTQYGCPSACATEPANATGTVLAISQYGNAKLGVPNWVEVAFNGTCATSIPSCTGWMGSDNMKVSGPPAARLTIAPTSASVLEGSTVQFAATETNTTAPITWSANAPNGLYTAPQAAGTATVTATAGTLTASATVTITAPKPAPTVTTSGDVITLKPTNVPCPASYSGTLTIDGVNVTFSGTCQ